MDGKGAEVNKKTKLPVPGEIFSNEKGQKNQIIAVAKHMVTKEKLVIYQALYGDFDIRALPLERFGGNKKAQADTNTDINKNTLHNENTAPNANEKSDEQCPKGMNRLLYAFLEADTVHDRLKLVKDSDNRKYIDDKCIDDMAASIDVTIDEGDIDSRIMQLYSCLETMKRFEVIR